LLRTMYEEIDGDNEDVSLWPCAGTEIPLITHSELSLNRLDEDGSFRPKPIDSIPSPGKHEWQLRSPSVAHLP
jgi:hypothetical protein